MIFSDNAYVRRRRCVLLLALDGKCYDLVFVAMARPEPRSVVREAARIERNRGQRGDFRRAVASVDFLELDVFELFISRDEIETAFDDRHADRYALERYFGACISGSIQCENAPVMGLRQEKHVAVKTEVRTGEVRTIDTVALESMTGNEAIDVAVVLVFAETDNDAQFIADGGHSERPARCCAFVARRP